MIINIYLCGFINTSLSIIRFSHYCRRQDYYFWDFFLQDFFLRDFTRYESYNWIFFNWDFFECDFFRSLLITFSFRVSPYYDLFIFTIIDYYYFFILCWVYNVFSSFYNPFYYYFR